mmetsp:Transcript_54799/g.130117  ORF Transcript_54799/g.130117 Transcript_54799/m.130117 type:complete len:298 (+) Transcript_54799:496-1389(+)
MRPRSLHPRRRGDGRRCREVVGGGVCVCVVVVLAALFCEQHLPSRRKNLFGRRGGWLLLRRGGGARRGRGGRRPVPGGFARRVVHIVHLSLSRLALLPALRQTRQLTLGGGHQVQVRSFLVRVVEGSHGASLQVIHQPSRAPWGGEREVFHQGELPRHAPLIEVAHDVVVGVVVAHEPPLTVVLVVAPHVHGVGLLDRRPAVHLGCTRGCAPSSALGCIMASALGCMMGRRPPPQLRPCRGRGGGAGRMLVVVVVVGMGGVFPAIDRVQVLGCQPLRSEERRERYGREQCAPSAHFP